MVVREGRNLVRSRLEEATNRIVMSTRAGLGQCFIVDTGDGGDATSAGMIEALLLEHRVECFIQSIGTRTGQLPAKKGVWIIDNAEALERFAVAAWLKTQLDTHYATLRVVLMSDSARANAHGEQNLSLLNPITV